MWGIDQHSKVVFPLRHFLEFAVIRCWRNDGDFAIVVALNDRSHPARNGTGSVLNGRAAADGAGVGDLGLGGGAHQQTVFRSLHLGSGGVIGSQNGIAVVDDYAILIGDLGIANEVSICVTDTQNFLTVEFAVSIRHGRVIHSGHLGQLIAVSRGTVLAHGGLVRGRGSGIAVRDGFSQRGGLVVANYAATFVIGHGHFFHRLGAVGFGNGLGIGFGTICVGSFRHVGDGAVFGPLGLGAFTDPIRDDAAIEPHIHRAGILRGIIAGIPHGLFAGAHSGGKRDGDLSRGLRMNLIRARHGVLRFFRRISGGRLAAAHNAVLIQQVTVLISDFGVFRGLITLDSGLLHVITVFIGSLRFAIPLFLRGGLSGDISIFIGAGRAFCLRRLDCRVFCSPRTSDVGCNDQSSRCTAFLFALSKRTDTENAHAHIQRQHAGEQLFESSLCHFLNLPFMSKIAD